MTHTSVQMTLAGGYSPGNCEFDSYFTPLMMMVIAMEFSVISLTTFCVLCFYIHKNFERKVKTYTTG